MKILFVPITLFLLVGSGVIVCEFLEKEVVFAMAGT